MKAGVKGKLNIVMSFVAKAVTQCQKILGP